MIQKLVYRAQIGSYGRYAEIRHTNAPCDICTENHQNLEIDNSEGEYTPLTICSLCLLDLSHPETPSVHQNA